jgi:hypothetical protein
MTKQQAQDWSSGVCSYQDKPSSCYPASSKPKDYGPSDPWQIPYLTASPGALSAVFLTDTTDSARVARTHPAIVLSAARSQARIAAGTLRAGFLTDTTDSARVARIGTRGRLASA